MSLWLLQLTLIKLMSCICKGVEPAVTYNNLGLPPEWYEAVEWVFPTWARAHALDTGQAVNLLKGAIVTADRLLTVSQVINAISYFYCEASDSVQYPAFV